MKRVTGQVALVTGGAGGIGWHVARLLATQGARVHVCDIDAGNIARANEQIADDLVRDRIVFRHLDVTDTPALMEWIEEVHGTEGGLDILVNNAAFIRWEDEERMSVDDVRRTFDVGFMAMVCAIKVALPLMRKAGAGHIVNMGSLVGSVHVNGPSCAYAASKAAVEAYTQVLRTELVGSGVHLLLVRPGAVAGTDFFGRHVSSERMPRMADLFPLARPEQVADKILRGVVRRHEVVSVPRYVPFIVRCHALAPALFRRLIAASGTSHRDYSRGPR